MKRTILADDAAKHLPVLRELWTFYQQTSGEPKTDRALRGPLRSKGFPPGQVKALCEQYVEIGLMDDHADNGYALTPLVGQILSHDDAQAQALLERLLNGEEASSVLPATSDATADTVNEPEADAPVTDDAADDAAPAVTGNNDADTLSSLPDEQTDEATADTADEPEADAPVTDSTTADAAEDTAAENTSPSEDATDDDDDVPMELRGGRRPRRRQVDMSRAKSAEELMEEIKNKSGQPPAPPNKPAAAETESVPADEPSDADEITADAAVDADVDNTDDSHASAERPADSARNQAAATAERTDQSRQSSQKQSVDDTSPTRPSASRRQAAGQPAAETKPSRNRRSDPQPDASDSSGVDSAYSHRRRVVPMNRDDSPSSSGNKSSRRPAAGSGRSSASSSGRTRPSAGNRRAAAGSTDSSADSGGLSQSLRRGGRSSPGSGRRSASGGGSGDESGNSIRVNISIINTGKASIDQTTLDAVRNGIETILQDSSLDRAEAVAQVRALLDQFDLNQNAIEMVDDDEE